MEINPLQQGLLTENSAGIGTVTRTMVRARAVELAVINGRTARHVSKFDMDQARAELTGKPDQDPGSAALESVPETGRWDPVPGSEGGKAPTSPSADEDEEGRSDNQKLVEEGVAGAEHDLMLEAARATEKRISTQP